MNNGGVIKPGECTIEGFYTYNSPNISGWNQNAFGQWTDWQTFPWTHESLRKYYTQNQTALNKAVNAAYLNCYGYLFNYYLLVQPADWDGKNKAKMQKDINYGDPGGLFPWGAGNFLGEVPSWLWIILIALAAGYFSRK